MVDFDFKVLRAVVDAAPDPILVVDGSGRIRFVNLNATDLFGWSRKELLGMTVEDLIPGSYGPAHVKVRERYLHQPDIRRMTESRYVLGVARDGREIPLDIKLSPLAMGDETFVVTSLRDIRELKRIEDSLRESGAQLESAYGALLEVNEEKNYMLGMAAHDLRNPLGSIQGFAASLSAGMFGPLRDEQIQVVERIQRAAEFMLILVEDLLDVSELDAGHLQLRESPVDIVSLVNECCILLRPIAERKLMGLAQVSALNRLVTIADYAKIEQVVNNLLGNAIKYSAPGTNVSVNVTLVNETITVSIADEGPGIHPDEVKKLFRPFGRASSRPTANERSTGLGLAITQRIVDAHGGRAWVHSTLGTGSTFSFSIPLRPVQAEMEKLDGAA
jgi:PAS domain S-box-containing protein